MLLARTVAMVRMKRQTGGASKRRKVPRARYPTLIESDYAKAIVDLVTRSRADIGRLIEALPEMLASARRTRGDRYDEDEAIKLAGMLSRARRTANDATNQTAVEVAAGKAAIRARSHHGKEFARQAKAALGVDLVTLDTRVPAIVKHFVAENVALIKSLGARPLDDIEKIVTRGFSEGKRHEELAKEIKERYAITERHARLIARDQIGKLLGQVAGARNKELGIKSFTWRTVRDKRVRVSHASREGQVYRYDKPHPVPGQEICCRCSAEPIFEDLLAELDRLEGKPAAAPIVPATAKKASAPLPVEAPAIVWEKKNPKRVAAGKLAGEASAERRREIYSAVATNLPQELQAAWEKDGHKFLKQEAPRVKGVKDRINASSKISEAFAEQYGSGESHSTNANEGDRSYRRAEIDAKHAEDRMNEQERKYYESMRREAEDANVRAAAKPDEDDCPF